MQIEELNEQLKSIKHELFEVRATLITSNNSNEEIKLLKEREKLLLNKFTLLTIEKKKLEMEIERSGGRKK